VFDTYTSVCLCRFLQRNSLFTDFKGYVLKLPSTTGRHGIKYIKSPTVAVDDIVTSVLEVSRRFGGQLPYVMLQRRLIFNIEYKVVLFNGFARFVSSSKGSRDPERPKLNQYDLRKFAETAIRTLQAVVPHCIADGLVRVDVFTDTAQGMVVNEFESLEANWHVNRDSDVNAMNADLITYWTTRFSNALEKDE